MAAATPLTREETIEYHRMMFGTGRGGPRLVGDQVSFDLIRDLETIDQLDWYTSLDERHASDDVSQQSPAKWQEFNFSHIHVERSSPNTWIVESMWPRSVPTCLFLDQAQMQYLFDKFLKPKGQYVTKQTMKQIAEWNAKLADYGKRSRVQHVAAT